MTLELERPAFIPPNRLLLGPGPACVAQSVLKAMGQPTIGHLDPEFIGMMDDLKAGLRQILRTSNDVTFPVSGPGSLGMEMCIANAVQPGTKVIVGINGVFGERMADMVSRYGGEAVAVRFPAGETVAVDDIAAAIAANPDARFLAFVHAETSTGIRSDAEALCVLASRHGLMSIVDTVTSLGGIPVEIDGWGADAVFSGSQKCLSCPPGLSPVSFSDRFVAYVQSRGRHVASWFLDLRTITAYWRSGSGPRAYHHTAPTNALFGLYEGVRRLLDEGLEKSWRRHADLSRRLVSGLGQLGLGVRGGIAWRLPQLTVVTIPDGVDDCDVRRKLLNDFGIEIGAGLGDLAGKVWRIGLMGASAAPENVDRCLYAFRSVLPPVSSGSASSHRLD